MALVLEYNTQAPGVTVQRIRSDFEAIWKQNIKEITITKKSDWQAGDYFHEGMAPGTVAAMIFLNLQGVSTEHYERKQYGITTVGATYHAYARWFEDIDNLDEISFDGHMYIVKNHNKSMHNGSVGFQEFDLFRVDHVAA
jgi:hypothetical protein